MAKDSTSEVKTENVAPITLTLDDYVKLPKNKKMKGGTVASFKFEAKQAGEVDDNGQPTPRTEEEWDAAFDKQRNKIYV